MLDNNNVSNSMLSDNNVASNNFSNNTLISFEKVFSGLENLVALFFHLLEMHKLRDIELKPLCLLLRKHKN